MRHRDDAPDPSPRTSTFFFSTHSCCHILILKSRDFQFEIWPADYEGDGSSFQKFAFKDVGEIDFIVGRAMTPSPTAPTTIEGEATLLETIPEIIAKKIYYRGSSLRPRDIFDIAAAGEHHTDSVIDALRSYRTEVRTALKVIERLNPDFVDRAIAQLSIDDKFHPVALTALKRTKALLDAV